MKFAPPLTTAEVVSAFNYPGLKVESLAHGIGGQGVVFKATSGAGAVSALKIYYPGSTNERTQREVDALRRISCPSLGKVLDTGTVEIRSEQCIYVVSEFIAGTALNERVSAGPMPLNQVAKIGHDVALAIEALWAERIVHRDIKPNNVMLTHDGRAVLIDLGVARHLSMDSLTTVGKTWGTEGYMSPEQCAAMRQLSCKSDVYALGVVLRECIAGRHPTGANQRAMLLGSMGTCAVTGSNLPADFVAMIDSTTAKEPFRRPTPRLVAQTLAAHF